MAYQFALILWPVMPVKGFGNLFIFSRINPARCQAEVRGEADGYASCRTPAGHVFVPADSQWQSEGSYWMNHSSWRSSLSSPNSTPVRTGALRIMPGCGCGIPHAHAGTTAGGRPGGPPPRVLPGRQRSHIAPCRFNPRCQLTLKWKKRLNSFCTVSTVTTL